MVQSEEVRTHFVARLKQAMAAENIPTWGMGTRLSKEAGVTAKAASKWLNAEAMPGRANMIAIADWLNVRVEWLAHGAGEMKAAANTLSSAGAISEARGDSYAVPAVVREISRALADGSLTAEDGEQLRLMAQHLVAKNRKATTEVAHLPAHLEGLAEAAINAAERGENAQDMLKMVEHGLKKSQPQEGPQQDGKPKARSS